MFFAFDIIKLTHFFYQKFSNDYNPQIVVFNNVRYTMLKSVVFPDPTEDIHNPRGGAFGWIAGQTHIFHSL